MLRNVIIGRRRRLADVGKGPKIDRKQKSGAGSIRHLGGQKKLHELRLIPRSGLLEDAFDVLAGRAAGKPLVRGRSLDGGLGYEGKRETRLGGRQAIEVPEFVST